MLTKDNQMLLTGVNSVGLISLLAFTVRTFNDIASSMEDLRSEIETIKQGTNDTSRRTNIALNHLNSKLEQNIKTVRAAETALAPRLQSQRTQKVYVREEPEEEPEESFSGNDEISGALSDLLGS
jgi:uncharacterized protein YoxC